MKVTSSRRYRGRVLLCLGTVIVLFAASPTQAVAEPGVEAVPDDGSRPAGDPGTAGADPVPTIGDSPIAGPGISRGPYANRIAEKARTLAELGEKTTAAAEKIDTLKTQTDAAYIDWLGLETEATAMNELAAEMAAKSYQEEASQIPGLTDRFEELFNMQPGLLTSDEDAIVSKAVEARTTADIARARYDAAEASQALAKTDHSELAKELKNDNKELEELIVANKAAIELQEKQREGQNLHEIGDIGKDVDGYRAADEAQRSVEWALKQIGLPYVWGAEGPSAFDCSGLVQAAYASQQVRLPRVANDQFRATEGMKVDVGQMLPGDLIFYGDRPGDWTSVYHVAIYVGDGQMIHAPRPGDVVKIVPVWFDDFFGVHRVVEAISTTPEEPTDDVSPVPLPEPTSVSPSEGVLRPGDGSDDGQRDEPGPAPTPTPTP